MPGKQVREVREVESYMEQTIIVTEDNQHYVFIRPPWLDVPMFSHRYLPNPKDGQDHRTYTNRLPASVEEEVSERWSGYHKMTPNKVEF